MDDSIRFCCNNKRKILGREGENSGRKLSLLAPLVLLHLGPLGE